MQPQESDEPYVDQDEPNPYRDIGIPLAEAWVDCIRMVCRFKGSKEFAFDCLVIAMGMGSYEFSDPRLETIAAKYKNAKGKPMTKAHASAMVKKFQKVLSFIAAPGQRSMAGCLAMRHSRINQTQLMKGSEQ